MSRLKRILFVAGDGAAGRAVVHLMNACRDLEPAVQMHFRVEAGAGAAALCQSENIPHDEVCHDSVFPEATSSYDVVVAGLSGTSWRLEDRVIRESFTIGTPVVRVSDHPLATAHGHFATLTNDWYRAHRPPLTVTALHASHAEEILLRYPQLAERVLVAGNPLDTGLEALRDRLPDTRAAIRAGLGVKDDALLAAVFLSGNTETEFEEMASMISDAVLPGLKRFGTLPNVLLDVHHELARYSSRVTRLLARWKSQARIIQAVPQNEMIVASDVVITSPFSTTSGRAIACGIPLIQMGTMTNAARLRTLTGKTYPYTSELACGAALWADGTEMFADVLLRAMDPARQRSRMIAAQRVGLTPPSGTARRIASHALSF